MSWFGVCACAKSFVANKKRKKIFLLVLYVLVYENEREDANLVSSREHDGEKCSGEICTINKGTRRET